MAENLIASDQPICEPGEDQYGVDGFAQAIAASIRNMSAPNGAVIALNGRWGSGKTSTINLVRHHLTQAVDCGSLEIVQFNSWWFRGEHALAHAFFGELQAALKPGLAGRAKKLIPKLGANVLKAGSAVGPAVALGVGAGLGAVAGGTMDWLSKLIDRSDSVDRLHREIATALADQPKRYLVIVDDIDRLAPDEAVMMFRLIKSVGRLPNVIYLIAYDREIAERVVSERYPSEGPHFLEKIIQAAFDLPLPSASELHQRALASIAAICGEPDESAHVDIGNMFHAIIAPELKTPRDVLRYANALNITWPAVKNEVSYADFIALEALRLFQPGAYGAVRANKDAICSPADNLSREERAAHYDALLLNQTPEADRERVRRGLMRLFPQLQGVWANIYHQSSGPVWTRARRVCSKQHFETYFRFTLDPDAVSKSEIEALLARAGDSAFVKDTLRSGVGTPTRPGGTRAALLLDELSIYGPSIAKDDVEPFLGAVFEIADELTVEADMTGSVGGFGSELRLYWLTREALGDRFSLKDRSRLLRRACREAGVGWLAYFANSVHQHHFPHDGKEPKREQECLVDEESAIALRDQALEAIRHASANGTLIDHDDLAHLMFRWRSFADDDGREVQEWANAQLENDAAVIRLAAAFTGQSTSWGMGFAGLGDLVAQRHTTAQVKHLDEIMDRARFRGRLEQVVQAELLTSDAIAIARTFLTAWRRADRGPGDD